MNYKKRMKRARDGNAVIRDVPRRKSILSNEIIEASYREVVADAKTEERAFAVRDRLLTLKDSIENNFFDLCELLLEAKEGEYHLIYGFERFGDWVEQGSDLDLSARSAYYYINIGEKARELGLTREMLKQAKISKLKEIFTLEPEENGDDMKRLVESASSSSLEEIKKEVAKAKEKSGVPTAAYMTLKLDPMVKDTVEEAIELARRNYGDTIDEYGEVKDASVSKCVELICVSYLQDPNNHQQE